MSSIVRPSPQLTDAPSTLADQVRSRPLRAQLLNPAVLAIADQAVISAARFAVTVLIGRMCGQDQLGIYYLAASILLFAQGIQAQVVRAPFTVYCPKHKGNRMRAFTGSVFVHQQLLAATTVIGILLFATVASLCGVAPNLVNALLMLALVIAPLLVREFIRGVSIAHLRIGVLLAIDVAVAVMQIGGLALLALLGLLTVPLALLILGVGCAVACGGWFWSHRSTIQVRLPRVVNDWRLNWQFSKWALASHFLGSTSPILVAWILAAASGTSATGQFAACMSIVGLAHVVVGGLSNLAVPQAARAFARDRGPGVRKAMTKTALMLSLPAIVFVVFAFFAADPLARLIYGDQFVGCGLIVTVLGLWLLANNLGIAAGSTLWAIGKPRANMPADVAAFVVTVLLTAALAVPFGVIGCAWAMFIGIFLATIIRWTTARRTTYAL